MKTVRNYPYKYKIYTKEQIDTLLDEIESELPDMTNYYTKTETDTLLGNKQGVLTAGSNVSISEENVISATDTKYTAGNNITITDENVINAIVTDSSFTLRTTNDVSDCINPDGTFTKDVFITVFGQQGSSGTSYKGGFYLPKGVNYGSSINFVAYDKSSTGSITGMITGFIQASTGQVFDLSVYNVQLLRVSSYSNGEFTIFQPNTTKIQSISFSSVKVGYDYSTQRYNYGYNIYVRG